METFTASRTFDVPAAAAWAVVADHGRDHQWRDGVLEMGSQPAGLLTPGAAFHEVLRLGGRTYRNGGVIERVVPGERFDWRTTSGADAHGSRTIRPLGPGRCEVDLVLHVEPHGANRLLMPVLRGVLAKGLRADLERLGALLAREVAPV
ncbi:MAG: SRPBCC family protein [Acidimicrobiia bacterium]